MEYPIKIGVGLMEVTIFPGKRFENRDTFEGMINPEELSSCWTTLKHIVDRTVDEQIDRSKSVVEQNAKIMTIVDIYNTLHSKITVDEDVLLKEVLKTGYFSEDEAKSLIKKVKEEKIEDGMTWY
jgi:hypothetical protein